MKAVFLVTHAYERRGEEHVKIIGAYASKKDAQLAVRRKKRHPGFRRYPKGFYISDLELGRDQWSGGFFTYYYPEKKKSPVKRATRKTKLKKEPNQPLQHNASTRSVSNLKSPARRG